MSKYEHIQHHQLRNVAMILEGLDKMLDIEASILTTSGQDEAVVHLTAAKRSIKHAASLVDDGDHALAHNL